MPLWAARNEEACPAVCFDAHIRGGIPFVWQIAGGLGRTGNNRPLQVISCGCGIQCKLPYILCYGPTSVGLRMTPIELPCGARTYQTSPARQSHINSAEVSNLISTGSTNTVPSSPGVRVGPVGVSADVGPRHGDHPRAVYRLRARTEELSAPNW